MKKIRIAVLAGGWSAERPISLSSGRQVFEGFQRLGWKPLGLDLSDGDPRPATPSWAGAVEIAGLVPVLKQARIQAVFLCLHGPGGEDGCIQGLLELAGIPYTGSGVQASSVAMDKALSKKIFRHAGLLTPDWHLVPKGSGEPYRRPSVVKPPCQGSSVGVTLVRKVSQMAGALKLARKYDPVVMVEDLVEGRELTVGILGNKALPVIEIQPRHEFYDWHSKYAEGGSRHLCPAPLSNGLSARVRALALEAHQVLGCRAYSRVDFMLDRKQKPWLIEVNTLPGMTPTSLLPDSARVAGMDYEGLLVKMLEFSLKP